VQAFMAQFDCGKEKINKMRYIYLLKDPISKEVVYVGETSNPKVRYTAHCKGQRYDSEDKLEWVSTLRAIGLKPLFEIIDTAEDRRDALIKENAAIVSYMKCGVKLFNIRNNVTLKQYNKFGQLISEYTDGKRAFEITGIRPRVDRYTTHGFQWTYGAFNLDLFKQKELAKKVLCKPVIQIDKEGNIVGEFDGVRIAHAKTGIDHRSIAAVAAGTHPTRKRAGGYFWKYKD
jgi:hypothetical protein